MDKSKAIWEPELSGCGQAVFAAWWDCTYAILSNMAIYSRISTKTEGADV